MIPPSCPRGAPRPKSSGLFVAHAHYTTSRTAPRDTTGPAKSATRLAAQFITKDNTCAQDVITGRAQPHDLILASFRGEHPNARIARSAGGHRVHPEGANAGRDHTAGRRE